MNYIPLETQVKKIENKIDEIKTGFRQFLHKSGKNSINSREVYDDNSLTSLPQSIPDLINLIGIWQLSGGEEERIGVIFEKKNWSAEFFKELLYFMSTLDYELHFKHNEFY